MFKMLLKFSSILLGVFIIAHSNLGEAQQWREIGPVSTLLTRSWAPDSCDYRLRFPTITDLANVAKQTNQSFVPLPKIDSIITPANSRFQESTFWSASTILWESVGASFSKYQSFMDEETAEDFKATIAQFDSEQKARGMELSLDVDVFRSAIKPYPWLRNVHLNMYTLDKDLSSFEFQLDTKKVFLQERCPQPSPSPSMSR